MSLLAAILIGLGTGFVFGIALEKSRVFEPGVIIGQMQFKNFIMLKVFLAAVITGLVVLALMNGLFGVKLHLKPLVWRADIVGGLVLGIGIVLAGACPGTTLAQIGAGYRDAWFVLLGGIAGGAVYGYLESGSRPSYPRRERSYPSRLWSDCRFGWSRSSPPRFSWPCSSRWSAGRAGKPSSAPSTTVSSRRPRRAPSPSTRPQVSPRAGLAERRT